MKRAISMLICALLCFATVNAQESQLQSKVYDVVEVMPEYPGGFSQMMIFLKQNVKYPEVAKQKKIEGRSVVRFIVEKDGSMSSIQVVRSAGKILDEEAIRVVKMMPKWKPGLLKNKPVRVKFVLPVAFKLK